MQIEKQPGECLGVLDLMPTFAAISALAQRSDLELLVDLRLASPRSSASAKKRCIRSRQKPGVV